MSGNQDVNGDEHAASHPIPSARGGWWAAFLGTAAGVGIASATKSAVVPHSQMLELTYIPLLGWFGAASGILTRETFVQSKLARRVQSLPPVGSHYRRRFSIVAATAGLILILAEFAVLLAKREVGSTLFQYLATWVLAAAVSTLIVSWALLLKSRGDQLFAEIEKPRDLLEERSSVSDEDGISQNEAGQPVNSQSVQGHVDEYAEQLRRWALEQAPEGSFPNSEEESSNGDWGSPN